MVNVLSSGWNVTFSLLVAGIIGSGALMVSEARGYGGAPCMVSPNEPPEENCFCNGSGGGAQCWNGASQEKVCASNSINGTWMPVWDEEEEEWTDESCADAN